MRLQRINAHCWNAQIKANRMISSMKRITAPLALYFLAATAYCAAATPWDGTWRFDPARSRLKPGKIRIERRGDGYQWNGALGYHAPCNGVPSPGPDGFSITCTEKPEEVRTTLLEHGRPFSTSVYRLELGGKSLQVSTEYMHGRQPHALQSDEYVRTSGTGNGLEGTWQGTRTTLRGPLTYVLRLHDGALYYLDTMEGAETDSKLDGSEAIFRDSHPDNVRWINRWEGRRRIFGAYLVDGKPHLQEILELSPDGKTLKNWVVGDDDNIYVLDKH